MKTWAVMGCTHQQFLYDHVGEAQWKPLAITFINSGDKMRNISGTLQIYFLNV